MHCSDLISLVPCDMFTLLSASVAYCVHVAHLQATATGPKTWEELPVNIIMAMNLLLVKNADSWAPDTSKTVSKSWNSSFYKLSRWLWRTTKLKVKGRQGLQSSHVLILWFLPSFPPSVFPALELNKLQWVHLLVSSLSSSFPLFLHIRSLSLLSGLGLPFKCNSAVSWAFQVSDTLCKKEKKTNPSKLLH